MNTQNRLDQNAKREKIYRFISVVAVAIMAFLFAFPLYWIITGPTVPAAIRWLLNTVFMSVASMLLTCLTAAMAG